MLESKFSHVDLVCTSLERSLAFYGGLLAPLGWSREDQIGGERGEEVIESGPREYDYTPGYYAVFFSDPDGIKLEILHRPDRDA